MRPVTYAYGLKLSTALFGVAFSATLTVWGAHVARTNQNGLIIRGLIHLSPSMATAFFWLTTLLLGLMLAACLFLTFTCFNGKRAVTLLPDRIEAVLGAITTKKVIVPYSSITKLELQAIRDQKILYIHHRCGRIALVPALLPKRSDLDDIYSTLLSRTGG